MTSAGESRNASGMTWRAASLCEIRKQDVQGAELKVVLKDENTFSVQRSVAGRTPQKVGLRERRQPFLLDILDFLAERMSSTTSSSSSSGASDARYGDDNQESLADRIQNGYRRK
jgi:hypothetical protein